MKYIIRKRYLDKMIRLSNTPSIKVITGIRRCGKSVLLSQFIDYLKENEKDANIIFINLQELENASLLSYHALHQYVMDHYQKNKHNVVLIDEVELCSQFELAINSLHSKNLFDIYITGSNAFLLTSDLATLFSGRVMDIEVFPFSYHEYLEYFHMEDKVDEMLFSYLMYGGMSENFLYSEEEKLSHLKNVYNTILIKDLIDKYKIKKVNDLLLVSRYMMANIGNLISPNNITNSLNTQNKSDITRKTVDKYISFFENSFMFYKVKRYDVRGKKYLESSFKYYLCDVAFKYALTGTVNMDYGRAYENMVYIELLRRGYDVYIGKLYDKEIDFVAIKQAQKLYIQVCDFLDDPHTFEREYKPLLAIKDAYPKMIIARTHHDETIYEGIKIIDIAYFLNGDY